MKISLTVDHLILQNQSQKIPILVSFRFQMSVQGQCGLHSVEALADPNVSNTVNKGRGNQIHTNIRYMLGAIPDFCDTRISGMLGTTEDTTLACIH